MRKTVLAFGTIAILAIGSLTAYRYLASDSGTNEITPKKPQKLSKQARIDLAMKQEFERTKDPALNAVPRERLAVAEAYRKTLIEARERNRTMGATPGITWQERGPNNVGGRTRAILFDLNDAANGYRKVWAGSVGGGLWYTNDITAATPVWNKVSDQFENLAVSCIAQNPANPQEMYFGTGEGWFNVDAIRGMGIWKTTNGGSTWTRLTSTANFAYVNDLLVDNSGNVYAALNRYSGTDAPGIQKSTNGGTSWTQVLGSPGFGSSSIGADLELAANGDLYATLGVSGSNGGVYLSNRTVHGTSTGNSGTWSNITPSTVGVISSPANFWHRIKLAPAPSNANLVYALFQGFGSDDCTSIQCYDKSTNTWSVKAVPTIIDQGANSPFTRFQAWYDLALSVDPNNANSIYIAGIDALRSDNGGTTWSQMTTWSLYAAVGFNASQNVHADHHAFIYAPGSSSRALLGTDGGIYYTANANIAAGSKPTFSSKNTGYNVTQYYSCAISPSVTNYFLAGAQDNGSHKFTTAGLNNATQVSGGDGGFCHIDQDNHNIQVTSYVYNNYYVSTNGGASFTDRSLNNNGDFINASDYDNTGNVLYAGDAPGSYLRWTDVATGGSTFSTVSCTQFAGAYITHVMVSPTVANRVFFGLSNGSVVRVDNANTAASPVAGTVIRTGSGSVSCIAIDPGNADHLLVTYSNYGVTSIYETTNASAGTPTWTAVEGNLPDMPVRWAMFDPRNADCALVATELGVWSTNNLNAGTTDWQPTNSGMANVRVDMLQYRASDRTIVAATHGRGLFTAQVPVSLPMTLVRFDGSLGRGQVNLAWSTTAEEGAKNFDVEKSTDGTRFYKIGVVEAKGNSTTRSNYGFADKQVERLNYYRLKMNDQNGESKYSSVVLVKGEGGKQAVWATNNPFNGHLNMLVAENVKQLKLQLHNSAGALLCEKTFSNAAGLIRWNIERTLPRGLYVLTAVADGQITTQKLVKE